MYIRELLLDALIGFLIAAGGIGVVYLALGLWSIKPPPPRWPLCVKDYPVVLLDTPTAHTRMKYRRRGGFQG